MIGLACFSHILFFCISLAMVGFQPMMLNGFLATWAYSCYLTLNELSIVLYLIFLVAITISGIYWGHEQDQTRWGLAQT